MLDEFLSKTLNDYLATTIVLGNQHSMEIEFSLTICHINLHLHHHAKLLTSVVTQCKQTNKKNF